MTAYKNKITKFVGEYEKLFADEFAAFQAGMKEKRKEGFAETGMDVIERALYEIPETLHAVFSTRMEEDELQWLQTKEGGRWFAKTFKQYCVGEKV